MNKPLKPIPKFASEAEERAFWETPDNDSTAYLDWSKAKRAVFPNLKPSTQAISLRLPVSLLSAIKVRANRMDVPYQSLIKTWLAEKAAETDQRSAQALPRQPRPWKAPKVKHAILPKAALKAGQTLAVPILVPISGGPVVLIKICVPCVAALGLAVNPSAGRLNDLPAWEPHARQIDGGGQLKLQINGILCRLPVDTPDFTGQVRLRINRQPTKSSKARASAPSRPPILATLIRGRGSAP